MIKTNQTKNNIRNLAVILALSLAQGIGASEHTDVGTGSGSSSRDILQADMETRILQADVETKISLLENAFKENPNDDSFISRKKFEAEEALDRLFLAHPQLNIKEFELRIKRLASKQIQTQEKAEKEKAALKRAEAERNAERKLEELVKNHQCIVNSSFHYIMGILTQQEYNQILNNAADKVNEFKINLRKSVLSRPKINELETKLDIECNIIGNKIGKIGKTVDAMTDAEEKIASLETQVQNFTVEALIKLSIAQKALRKLIELAELTELDFFKAKIGDFERRIVHAGVQIEPEMEPASIE